MDKNNINEVKNSFEKFNKLIFPKCPAEDNYESVYSDLVSLDADLAGIIHSYIGMVVDDEKKKLFFQLKKELQNFLDSHKDKKDEIVRYFSELMKIVEMIDF